MGGFIWHLTAGIAGWLTGKYASNSLDIVFGIIGSYLFFWAVTGQGDSLSRYATAVIGSITLVGAARQISVKYLFSGSR